MPILKTEILGTDIEISYEKKDLDRLSNLIANFKIRLKEFPMNEKVSNFKIMFLAALKAEDQLEDMKKLASRNQTKNEEIEEQKNVIQKLQKDTSLLKDKLDLFDKNEIIEKENNEKLIQEVNELHDLIISINLKIQKSLNN